MEIENYPVQWNDVDPALLKAEARRVFDLQQADRIRQIHFRQDTKSAVIEWECDTEEEVRNLLDTFPLVQAGLIHFEIIPLIPYSGFNRLFR
ncbi:hypothetical protein ADM99_14065 [Leptolinea tardivitalis]|uniref:Muconolactone isomerase domain-containing protein n=2 Tax=Leptolinea tardivitalis TaxID=229920 RepID=A0A0P6WWD1_9CHLR|nr:hypothetical protein ADM99_14065 [Leptolinea tardivitalis]